MPVPECRCIHVRESSQPSSNPPPPSAFPERPPPPPVSPGRPGERGDGRRGRPVPGEGPHTPPPGPRRHQGPALVPRCAPSSLHSHPRRSFGIRVTSTRPPCVLVWLQSLCRVFSPPIFPRMVRRLYALVEPWPPVGVAPSCRALVGGGVRAGGAAHVLRHALAAPGGRERQVR